MSQHPTLNSSLGTSDNARNGEDITPTTPKPRSRLFEKPPQEGTHDPSTPTTPRMPNFGGVPGQRPLPQDLPNPADIDDYARESEERARRDTSQSTTRASHADIDQDIEMGEGNDNDGGDGDGSDNESVTSESQRPSKKKKGQRFFCTEFPPCQLSFTRSEHLARHIRKHTGERPFQCHCSRRFSRLDNLRQHAQTVHVNEDIPGDSLAATSTRFQRQIRTDRVRPPNGRSRANTLGSQGGHSRGHSRNLSTSSIGSTASSIGLPEDTRPRPPPLAMANDASGYDAMSNSPGARYSWNQSPSGYSTPTSVMSNGTTSPRYVATLASPVQLSRSQHYNGARAPNRRLSVPSGNNPFQSPNAMSTYPPPPYYSPTPSASSMAFSPQSGSIFASPTSSVFSHGRRESEAELEYRRRTWHPGTYTGYQQRPATSGLSYHQTPDDSRPAFSGQPAAASQVTRLPGIESFDHAPQTQPSPMLSEATTRPPSSGRTSGRASDAGLNQTMTKLEIGQQSEGQRQLIQAVTQPPLPTQQSYFPPQQIQFVRPGHMSMPEPVTPRMKRQAWYGGPVQVAHGVFVPHRTSPEDSGSSDGIPTPSTSQGGEYHPVIINPNGMMEAPPPGQMVIDDQGKSYVYAQSQPTQTYALQVGHDPHIQHQQSFNAPSTSPPNSNDMGRLEALVAVATSENRAVEHRP